MDFDLDSLMEHTTANFSGCISLIDPQMSWVAKWNLINHKKPGVYAIDVGTATLKDEEE